MSKPILVANWKNNPDSPRLAAALLTSLSKRAAAYKKLSLFIAPPYIYMESVGKRARGFSQLASQDIFFTAEGVHTGAITPAMLKGLGVKLSIVGHSERRALGETNEVVAAKLKTALLSGLTPLLCVGELERDEEGKHLEELRDQLKFSLEGVRRREDAGKLIIAYEPVWAIGRRGKGAMTPPELSQVVIFIKKVLNDIFGREAAEKIPVLYGGSVDSTNAELLYKEGGIRGLLVGRASLQPQEFTEIAKSLHK